MVDFASSACRTHRGPTQTPETDGAADSWCVVDGRTSSSDGAPPGAEPEGRSSDQDLPRDRRRRRTDEQANSARTAADTAQRRRCDSCGQPVGSWDIDKLTGVLNRWGWDERAPRTLALKDGGPVALLVVDLDAFKSVNDSLGHLAGDTMLRSVAGVLRDGTRGSDLVGRFGGDEFLLLLPSTDLDGALSIARRIGRRLREVVVADERTGLGTVQGCSASIGIALACSESADLDTLLLDADSALLAAKSHGGNRSCVRPPRAAHDRDRVSDDCLVFDPPLAETSTH
jgi:diguanylate cyclase (GGDEF)-like protein